MFNYFNGIDSLYGIKILDNFNDIINYTYILNYLLNHDITNLISLYMMNFLINVIIIIL